MTSRDIIDSFRKFDVNGNGFIDRKELGQLLQGLDSDTWTEESLDNLLSNMDKNGDGLIDYLEFASWLDMDESKSLLVSLPGNEQNASEENNASNALTFEVQFMDGETITCSVSSTDTVASIIKQVDKVRSCPSGKKLAILHGSTILKDSDKIASLTLSTLSALIISPHLAYRMIDSDEIKLYAEGDPGFDESYVKKAQVPPDKWVPKPSAYEGCLNFATESLGATATVSSNIWGASLAASEKLKNVLRLGSMHGDPRFVGGDNSFIFRENQSNQTMLVDLGQICNLVRVGSMCYGDRFLDFFAVDTRCTNDDSEEWESWGSDRTYRRSGGVVYLDREPTAAQFIRIKCSSGHYYGAGARLGPIFAYGLHANTQE